MPKKKVNRKTATEKVEDILTKGLEGEDIGPMLSSLSDAGLVMWEQMLTEFRNSGDSEMWGQLMTADYAKPPPSIQEFIESDYYLGSILVKSDDSEGLFPAWRELLIKDFNYDSAVHNLVLTGSLGIGKCWCSGTYLILYDGNIRHVEDIKVGDVLLGDDSTPRQVLTTTTGEDECYKIYPQRGEPFTVNGNHILVLKSTISDKTEEITVNEFIAWPRERKHTACLYRVAVDWQAQNLPIPPYILGLWLGDGHSNQTVLTTMDAEIENAWVSYGHELGLTPSFHTAGKRAKAKSIQLSYRDEHGIIRKGKNQLRNRLQALGVASNDQKTKKNIPRIYLATARYDRLELLAGLIDTDGYRVKGQEGTYEITLSLKGLADQVRFLAHSLGYSASTRIKIVNATAYFKTTICGAYDVPVRLERKKSNGAGKTRGISNLTGTRYKNDVLRSRFAVIPVGKQSYYGFTLTGNGRCLLKDFTVTHNTYVMVTILLYRIVMATLLRNPHNYFSLGKNSKIVYSLLSITKAAVTETAFGDAQNFMASSPYFLEECKFNPDQKYTNFRIPLRNSIVLTAGSKGHHLLGRNVVGVALDEGNWRLEAEPDTKAYELYSEVRTRINNRFRKAKGFLPAISILASSAKDESSFTEQVIKEIVAANDPKTQLIYRSSVYKIKRHTLKLGHRWFKVAYGLKNIAPLLLAGWYDEQGNPLPDQTCEPAPSGCSVELVPEMYFEEFKRRPLNALRDVCGISTGGTNRLFSSMIDFERCFSGGTKVITYDGIHPIKNLAGKIVSLLTRQVGPSGYCHPKWVDAEIKHFGKQRLWKIVLRRNRIEKIVYATAEHRWFVWNSAKYRPKLSENPTADLLPGNAIPAVYAQRVLFRSESPKGAALSPYGVAHGLVFGDGYLGSKNGDDSVQPARIVLFGEKDAQLIDWFPKKIQTKEVTIRSRLGTTDGLKINDLPRYFKAFPRLDESPSYLLGWLAGYFAADGHVDDKGAPCLNSANREHLEFVQLLCQRFGIRTTEIAEEIRQGCCEEKTPLYSLRFHVGALPDDFFLINEHRLRNKPRSKEAQCWVVESVEPTERVEDVYCAIVPETGSFVIEGNILTGNCVEIAEKDGVLCPTIGRIEMIPISMEDNKQVWDYLDHKVFITRIQSQYMPRRHPNALRYAHIDLAQTTMAGVAICHLVGQQLIENLVREGQPYSEYRLIVEYDFILTIIAGQVKPISLEKIQNFFIWLRNKAGFRFGLVTADQYQCLTGNTLVNTKRGLIPLEEINVGDTVQSRTGPSIVVNKFSYPPSPVIKIITQDGEILCGTPIHKIEAAKNCPRPSTHAQFSWMELRNLKIGDFVRLAEQTVQFDCPDAPLTMLDWAPSFPNGPMQTWIPPKVITVGLAEWIGLIWGDGSTSLPGTIQLTVSSRDLEDALALSEKLFGFEPNFRQHRKKGAPIRAYSVVIHSRKLIKWLKINGLLKSSGGKKGASPLCIPIPVMLSSRTIKAAFLRGLFSTDGSVNQFCMSLSSKWHYLLQQTQIILRTEFGLRSNIIENVRVGFGKKRTQYILHVGGSRQAFIEQIGFCYSSKLFAAEKIALQKGRKLMSRIESIEEGTAPVYDIEVEGDHSYVANGFISHNSTMPLQMLEARGFAVKEQSIDRNKGPYIAWRTAVEELRLRPYRHRHMMLEAEHLLDGDKKVDHKKDGSKDTTDGCAGAYMNAVSSEEKGTAGLPNEPTITPNSALEAMTAEPPLVDIPLPLGYTRLKSFKA